MTSMAISTSAANIVFHRSLILQMIRRQVDARYRGSLLGLLWCLVTPLLMLAVYSFVFGFVFSPRAWHAEGASVPFPLMLFAGLIPYNLFSEVIAKAPSLIVSNRNFVKKVVFPIETLPIISLGTALVQALVSFVVLVMGLIVFGGSIPLTALLLPVVLAPFLILTLGLAWALAALGVYLRDLAQLMPPLLSGLMFMSAIVYPLSALSNSTQHVLLAINPLVLPIEQVRRVLIYGDAPQWPHLGVYYIASFSIAYVGFAMFRRLRKGFADVV